MIAVTVNAQEGSATGQAANRNVELEEVVVTAQRRTESMQTTPIAVSVLDDSALERKGVVSIADLQNATPSLTVTNIGVVATANMRGIGLSTNSPQVVPGVATYRDGLWQPPVATTSSFYDIASVEVLRGPQGTFVGSNSTGGAIFINSSSPDLHSVHGTVEIQAGNYSNVGANGAVNLPLSDTLATRVAFSAQQRDSFYTNAGSMETPVAREFNSPGSLDEKNLRVGLLWKPSDALQFTLKSDFADKDTGGYAMKPVPTTTYEPFASDDPFTLNYDTFTQAEETISRNSLEIRWQPTPDGITYRSLTGYQYIKILNIYDIDATSSALPGPPAQSDYESIVEKPMTQEFNVISPTSGPLQWIVGAFYLHDTREVGHDIRDEAFPPHVLINFYTKLTAEAVFAQVNYDLSPSWELQVGGRYTHSTVENRPGNYIDVGPGIAFIDARGRHTDDVATGKIALNWTVNDAHFLYAFAAKGFKGGGFDFGTPPTQFNPEIVMDYELGWKANLFDGRVRTQIGAFWNDYQDLQVATISPRSGNNSLTNIGESTIKGVEMQIQAQIGDLRIDAGGAYVDSELGEISLVNSRLLPGGGAFNLGPQCGAGAPAPPGCFDYSPFIVSVSGRPNPYSPEWTFNAGVEYAFALDGGATLTPRVNYSYVGSQWTRLIASPATDLLASFGLVNASLSYETGDWRVSAYGTNLADKVYVLGQYVNAQVYGEPRQFGIRASKSF